MLTFDQSNARRVPPRDLGTGTRDARVASTIAFNRKPGRKMTRLEKQVE